MKKGVGLHCVSCGVSGSNIYRYIHNIIWMYIACAWSCFLSWICKLLRKQNEICRDIASLLRRVVPIFRACMPFFRVFMLFFRTHALLQGVYALLQGTFMTFFRVVSLRSSSELMLHKQTSTKLCIYYIYVSDGCHTGALWLKTLPHQRLLFHTRWKMVHASLRGKLELIWLYGDPIEGWHAGTGHIEWSPMHAEVALKVESAFTSWKTHLYITVDDYIYDFCTMCQVNRITGTRRPIRRILRDHAAER